MAEKESTVRVLGKELRPHAIWALIVWVGALVGSTMITAIAALWQKLWRMSLDWFIIGGLFVLSFAVLALLLHLVRKISPTPKGKLPEYRPTESGEEERGDFQDTASPTLADRIFALCKEMRLYLRTIEPMPQYGPYSPGSEPGPKWLSDVVIPWQKKFDAGYMLRFNDRVVAIRHELAERGLSDGEIDSFIAGDVHDDRMLRTTIKALIMLGAELDD